MDQSNKINVYCVQKASAPVAGWLNTLLSPILKVIRADPVPIQFSPLGRWGGMSAGSIDSNPDQRVQISTRLQFASRTAIAHIYVHEMTHNLLDGVEEGISHHHDAAFCCLYRIFMSKLDDAGIDTGNATAHANAISQYDHQNAAPFWAENHTPEYVWRPRELQWVLETAEKYRGSTLRAPELAQVIHDDYFSFVDGLMAEPDRLAAQKQLADARRAQESAHVEKMKSDLFWSRVSIISTLSLFLAVVYFRRCVCRAIFRRRLLLAKSVRCTLHIAH